MNTTRERAIAKAARKQPKNLGPQANRDADLQSEAKCPGKYTLPRNGKMTGLGRSKIGAGLPPMSDHGGEHFLAEARKAGCTPGEFLLRGIREMQVKRKKEA